MTSRARRTGTFGVVLAMAAVWCVPWVSVTGAGQVFLSDDGLDFSVLLTVLLLIVLDALRRSDRTISASFLLPTTALTAWFAYAAPGGAVASGFTEAHDGAGVVTMMVGCALTYASLFMRRPAVPARQISGETIGIDVRV